MARLAAQVAGHFDDNCVVADRGIAGRSLGRGRPLAQQKDRHCTLALVVELALYGGSK